MDSALGHFDLAQITLYVFWIFFAGLVYYLQREAQREGYPVEVDTQPGKFRAQSLMFFPPPKTFHLADGTSVQAPNGKADTRAVPGTPTARFPGAPLRPDNANPMRDSIGPGSWAERADVPDRTFDGRARIVPMRVATSYHVDARDVDPRGFPVVGFDRVQGGVVVDVWVDLAEHVLRYFEVEVGSGATARRVLLPANFASVKKTGRMIMVEAIKGEHFADVPGTAKANSVTLREEDQIAAYYGAGTLYATPGRQEPLL
jgi:photosynthetic reaction center H subunit